MAAENSAKYDKRLNYEEDFVVCVIIYGYTWDFEMNKYPKYPNNFSKRSLKIKRKRKWIVNKYVWKINFAYLENNNTMTIFQKEIL